MGSLAAGVVTGLGARLAMYVIRLLNDTHNGEVTHANAAVGQVTWSGTVDVIVTVLFFVPPLAALYLLVRRFLPGRPAVKGLLYGVVLLGLLLGGVIQDNSYEYSRYVSPAVSVPLFALLAPIYGVVQAVVAEGLGRGRTGPPANRWVRHGGRAGLVVVFVLGVLGSVRELRLQF